VPSEQVMGRAGRISSSDIGRLDFSVVGSVRRLVASRRQIAYRQMSDLSLEIGREGRLSRHSDVQQTAVERLQPTLTAYPLGGLECRLLAGSVRPVKGEAAITLRRQVQTIPAHHPTRCAAPAAPPPAAIAGR